MLQCKKGMPEDIEHLLDETLTDIQTANTDEELTKNEKYADFEQRICDILHPGKGVSAFICLACDVWHECFGDRVKYTLSFVIYTPNSPFFWGWGDCWLHAHALGAERDIEVNISDTTFEQNGAKITFHIYNDSCLSSR